ncbi:MAG: DUF262 domain-containing protein [Clostridiales Family XIII bacterium]|jgi:hypothetical protein|nr:DUF262 domain-containing protein [Clostridiales Family XIII bacterium]
MKSKLKKKESKPKEMEIELKEITIREVSDGYEDKAEEGVVGYGGKLDIRPPYQREFVYKDEKRNEVVRTIRKDFPLNVMYWVVRDDGGYEVMDGQQRIISFCQYVNNEFSVKFDDIPYYFHNLTKGEQDQILDYTLQIYFCDGTDKEKLDWFKIINIAGEKLTPQELRNAVYTGAWLSDAKTYFSKPNCPAGLLGKDYVKGAPIRQEYLETALKWLSCDKIEDYMSTHQQDQNANELWSYFQDVIKWVKSTFKNYRKEMKGLNWGDLYNKYSKEKVDTDKLEERISKLMEDEEVTNKSGIYNYVFSGDERKLSIRAFTDEQKREAYERQKGICPVCKKHFEIEEMEADHINPWSEGGKTIAENCQMLCKDDNRYKGKK